MQARLRKSNNCVHAYVHSLSGKTNNNGSCRKQQVVVPTPGLAASALTHSHTHNNIISNYLSSHHILVIK